MKYITIILLLISLKLHAPEYQRLFVGREFYSPYNYLYDAVCRVESGFDDYAYNPKEHAVGIAQIRQVRIDDYNKSTGRSFDLHQMYDSAKSRSVFMWYAHELRNPDDIIRRWNGSGWMSYRYLRRVKMLINKFADNK